MCPTSKTGGGRTRARSTPSTAPDLETLKVFCAERKAAILRDLAARRAAAERPAGTRERPAGPVLPEARPSRKSKGNGGASGSRRQRPEDVTCPHRAGMPFKSGE